MSESILKALMQLFAIIATANKEGVNEKSRSIVESYLRLMLSSEQVTEYLLLFDKYVEERGGGVKKDDAQQSRKRTSLNSVKVLRICEQINGELKQDQKLLVLLQLLEFISFGEEITEQEIDFVKTVSDIFNIPEDEYYNCHAFTLSPKIEEIPHKENALILDKNNEAPFADFKHMKFKELDGRILILFLPSINAYAFRYVGETDLYLNGHSIMLNRTYMLPKGSAIRSPRIGSIYYSDIVSKFISAMNAEKVVFTAKDVEFRFKGSKNGLHNFNFCEQGGELIGIMGGSGVGKSTLLNVLNGNLQPQSGEILINGYNIYTEKEMLNGVIGFVPQDDLLIEELTVYQNLYYSAKLCFSEYTEEQINEAVNKVLEDLDLKATADLVVGNPLNKTISGGQRKRLNIALELIREPLVMFVDEPTSGLSSMDSEMVMDLLKEQTLKGKLVIVNIHQPSSVIFKMFDKLLIMDKGGYLVYYGNPVDSVVYFKTMSNHVNATESECYHCGNINPEQVLQILESKVVDEYGRTTHKRKTSPEEWAKMYEEHSKSKIKFDTEKQDLPKNNFNIPGMFKQFRIFCERNILSKLANRQYMLINFLEAPVLALILAYFTKYIAGEGGNPNIFVFSGNENLPIYLFMGVVVSIFIGLTVSAEEIIRDRQLLKRESFLNLSHVSYLNSKIAVLFVISAIQTMSFVLIGNAIMEIHGMTLSHWLILFTASCVSNMIGLNISAALDSVVTIYILIPFLIVPQLLFSGTMVKFDKLNKTISSYEVVPPIGDLMPSRWAYEAIAVKQFRDNEYQKNFFLIEQKKSEAAYVGSYLVPALNNKIAKLATADEQLRNQIIGLLHTEVAKINARTEKLQFENLDLLTPENYNQNVEEELTAYLEKIGKFYQQKQNKAIAVLDREISTLAEELGGNKALVELKKNYTNEALSNFVLNRIEIEKIHDMGDYFIQVSDPIYKEPDSHCGRAHFYAPFKQIGNLQIDTFWFNIIVMWVMNIFLYVLLVADGLRWTITKLSKRH
ncbi:MAG: ATP-binding cassette domain-containing protein [Salinivirgaceae bacterium]|nr:ATP-binding cassette domain-containing protein [Salinivirgaceae bacterium]